MSNNQLHALLAVEPDLSQQSGTITKETVDTFSKKADHFDGVQKLYSSYAEDGEKIPAEIKEVVTTVQEKLEYAMKIVIKSIDATVSKEETNASGKAKANLTVDGFDFGDFAATSFIALERVLKQIRDEYKYIPTLDPTKTWKKNDTTGRILYETPVETKFRSIKKRKALIMAPATDKFPAQVQLIDDDEQVGKYDTVYRSGRLTPTEKSNLLEKIDNLILAVKRAREKANQVDVIQVNLGKKIFDFIHS